MKYAPEVLFRLFISGIFGLAVNQPLRASIAYGSINNFDTVNDTGHECHGFEIELDDCRSTDISYTYDWNHYGAPVITQDDSVAGHPKCLIRWASKKKPDGSWAAFTAIPTGPLLPTDGHQFTNPAVNFGGEHFGVGYTVQPSAIRYHWLIDDGAGNLINGGVVQVATPTFTYFPPVAGLPAQVQAVIEPPEPVEMPVREFGDPVWVKEIRTETHNSHEVKLRDLVSDDPADPDDKNWANGEPDEVEVEWQLLQTDYNKGDGGANGALAAAPEDLPNGDETVTRRYEFFKYVGPIDDESGEAKADKVGPDDIHGEGEKIINGVNVDLSTIIVVGDFTGSQMAAVDVDAELGLIDHLSEGSVETAYAARRIVIQGNLPFTATGEGDLPDGMSFDTVTGIISGTPEESGEYSLKVTASDGIGRVLTKDYTLFIAAAEAQVPQFYLIDTSAIPAMGGTTSGGGAFASGSSVTVEATPLSGYAFRKWTDNGEVAGIMASYTFTADVNHSLVAEFVAAPVMAATPPQAGSFNLTWPVNPPGWILEESPDLTPGSWKASTRNIQEVDGNHQLMIQNPAGRNFFRLAEP